MLAFGRDEAKSYKSRAKAQKMKNILMDEFSVTLDIMICNELQVELTNISRVGDCTSVYIIHNVRDEIGVRD